MSRFDSLLEEFFYRPDEDVAGLVDLGPSAEGAVPAVVAEAPEEFLAFRLESETYAIPIGIVREIVKVPSLTEIPRGEAKLLGVMNLRGEVLPVYDLKMRLRLADSPPCIAAPDGDPSKLPKTSRVVVLHADEGAVGVLVDQVVEVLRMRPSTIEPPPPGVAGERACVLGLGRRKESLYILLDVLQALS